MEYSSERGQDIVIRWRPRNSASSIRWTEAVWQTQGTFSLLPTCQEPKMDSFVQSSVPELATKTFRSSSTLKGNLIKFPKAVGSSHARDCSNGALELMGGSESLHVKTARLSVFEHICRSVCIDVQVGFQSTCVWSKGRIMDSVPVSVISEPWAQPIEV